MILRERGFWALTLLGLVFFFRPLFLGEIYFFRDLYLYFIPIKEILSDVLRAGEPPLWNPYLHGGQPLLADISSTVFYPSTLLYLVLPAARALSLDIVLHAMASAAALYLLARRLSMSQPTAGLAAVVYGYCGYTLSQANLYIRLLAMPYLPLMLWCWHGYLQSIDAGALPARRRRWWFGLVALGLSQLLTGSAATVVATWLTLGVWAIFHAPVRRAVLPRLRAAMLLGAAVAGLAAAQILPLAEMVRQSQRGAGLHQQTVGRWSLHPLRLPELAVPGFMGRTDVIEPGDYWGGAIVDGGFPYVLSLYLGAVVLALAVLAARGHGGILPRPAVRSLRLLAILAILGAFGRYLPGFEAFQAWVPGAGLLRYPIKFLTLGILPVALLAADGAEGLFRASGRRQRRLLLAAWTMAGAMALLATLWIALPAFAIGVQSFFFGRAEAEIESSLQQAWLWMTAIWAAATLALQLHRLKPGAWLPWVLVGLVASDLMMAGRRINPSVPPELLSQTPPAATLISRHLEDGRFYHASEPAPALRAPSADIHWFYRWTQEVLRGFVAASYRIPVIFHDDFDGLAPSRVMTLKWTLEALPWDRRMALLSAAAVRILAPAEELDLPGVEKLGTLASTGGPVHLYENTRAARRLQLVTAYHRAESADDAMAAMLAPGFDPRQHAVVEGEVAGADLKCRGAGRAVVTGQSLHRRRISVTGECPGLLVLSEIFYPGWQVSVDGAPAPVLRANVAFSAVWLDAGVHEVEWRYAPRSFRLGLATSGVTLGLLIWIGRRSGRRGRA